MHNVSKTIIIVSFFTGSFLILSIHPLANSKEPAIIQAAEDGNFRLLKKLITEGADVNTKNENNETVLMISISNLLRRNDTPNIEIVKYLINAGASVQPPATYMEGPLVLASKIKYGAPVVYILLSAGADVNQMPDHGNTPLMSAAFKHNNNTVKLLLEHHAAVNAKTNTKQETALHKAVFFDDRPGAIETIKILIAAGADVNARDKNGDTPLIEVARTGNIQTLQILIDAGAHVNQMNNNGHTALTILSPNLSNISKMELLINAGANVNQQDKNGYTLLYKIVAHFFLNTESKVKLIRYLTSKGANPNISSEHAPLMFAAINNDVPVVKALLESGANPNLRTSEGKTALSYIKNYETKKLFNSARVARLLRNAGAKD